MASLAENNFEHGFAHIEGSLKVVESFGALAIRGGTNPEVIRRSMLAAAQNIINAANGIAPAE